MKKYGLALIATYFSLTNQVAATELKPWHDTIYSTEFNGSCLIQQFNQLDTNCGLKNRSEIDAFYTFGALGVAEANTTVELELSALNSRHKKFGFSSLKATARYFLFNDVIGDPVSLAIGASCSTIFKAARNNIATFDHGGIAGEVHAAIGKEYSCEQFWVSRIWGVLGLGIADVGYPWARANLVWEYNRWEIHQLRIFANTLWGFGNKNLPFHSSFHGYGKVGYQAIDVGARYGYILPSNVFLGIEYAYRVFGRNCPVCVNLFKIEFNYPFSL